MGRFAAHSLSIKSLSMSWQVCRTIVSVLVYSSQHCCVLRTVYCILYAVHHLTHLLDVILQVTLRIEFFRFVQQRDGFPLFATVR